MLTLSLEPIGDIFFITQRMRFLLHKYILREVFLLFCRKLLMTHFKLTSVFMEGHEQILVLYKCLKN